MFICSKCKRVTEPGEKTTKKAVVVKDVIYPVRKHPKDPNVIIDPGGRGYQIVREVALCPNCA